MPDYKIALLCDRCFSGLERTREYNIWECTGCATRYYIELKNPAPFLSPHTEEQNEVGVWSFWREPYPPYFRYIGYQGKRVRLDIGEPIRRFQMAQLADFGNTAPDYSALYSIKQRIMNNIMRAIYELKPDITQAEVIDLLTKQQTQLLRDLT